MCLYTASLLIRVLRKTFLKSQKSVLLVFVVYDVVRKKKDQIVPASEEKKHKKLIQKLKDEESVRFANRSIISMITARHWNKTWLLCPLDRQWSFLWRRCCSLEFSVASMFLHQSDQLSLAMMEWLLESFLSSLSLWFVEFSMAVWEELIILIWLWYFISFIDRSTNL